VYPLIASRITAIAQIPMIVSHATRDAGEAGTAIC
jgi:hypothetical protein